ncbi:MAG: serine hydrolase domain-containing protein [Verrucomicrobiota bacterium]
MKIKTLFTLSLAFALSAAGQSQPLDKTKLDPFLDRLAGKHQAMGSLTIAKDGEVLYTRAIGYGQIDGVEKKPLNAASRFRIGSITKMFTAVMILQLVDEGKLQLTDPLDRFLPQVPNAPKITLAQILAHRSGIPNVRRERDPQRNVNTLPITKDEILALIVKATPDFEPDTRSLYSNSGFFLLGLIIEQVTGKSYAAALEERITAKLGLKDTYTATGSIDVSKGEALTYIADGPGWKQGIETHPSILFGAGQIVSTPHDLARFIHALFAEKLISPESLTRMKTIRDGEGLGLEPFALGGKTFYGHAGGGDNYGAWLAYLPEEKLAIAYTTNAKVYPVPSIVNGIADLYYNRPVQIPSFETIVVSPEILDRYVGVYSSAEVPVKFTITRQGSTLFIQPGKESPAALEATAEDKFQLMGGRIVFEFDAAKKQLLHKRGGPPKVFTKEE